MKNKKYCLLGSDNKPLKNDKGIIYKTVAAWKRWYAKNVRCDFPSKIIGVFRSDSEFEKACGSNLELAYGVPSYVRLSYCYQER